MNRLKYESYLKSDFWKLKRAKALKRAGNKCVFCGAKDNLQIHHNTYERLGNEHKTVLTVLCDSCHIKHHTTIERLLRKEIITVENEIIFTKAFNSRPENKRFARSGKAYLSELTSKKKILEDKLKEVTNG